MKKRIILLLATLMVLGQASPFIYAQGNIIIEEDTTDESIEIEIDDNVGENPELEIDDTEVYKRQVKAIRDEVNSLPQTREEHVELVKDFNEKSEELERNIEASIEYANGPEKAGMSLGSFSQIYDLSSIPQRLMLVARLCVAMRFATTTLRYKVDQAHTEIAEYIFAGLVIAVSPFHTVDDMKTYMAEFEVLKQKLLGYPDLTLNDTANLYVRSDLDAKLHKARMMKYNELKEYPDWVIKKLRDEIREVTNIRLRPQATVMEIYQASDRLDQAVAEAINTRDRTATKYEIQDLKALRRQARHERRMGDERKELSDAIARTDQEMLLIRPSSQTVQSLIQMFKILLSVE